MLGLEKAVEPVFAGRDRDVTEENIQARARGVILMAISNKFGLMVVTTGNKSEMSVGYATLYGDMNGGFNPIKDLYKTQVFRLCRLRNSWKPEAALGPDGEVIPENIIVKPPTAELRENQKDQDSLPPYDMLDQILERLVEREEPVATIVAAGFDRDIVLKVEPPARPRRIQAAAGGARRQGDVEEFRPRPPLSDRQSLPRHRRAVAGAGSRRCSSPAPRARPKRSISEGVACARPQRFFPSPRLRGEVDARSARGGGFTFFGIPIAPRPNPLPASGAREFAAVGASASILRKCLALTAPAGTSARPRAPCGSDRASTAPRQAPHWQRERQPQPEAGAAGGAAGWAALGSGRAAAEAERS